MLFNTVVHEQTVASSRAVGIEQARVDIRVEEHGGILADALHAMIGP